LKIKAVIIGVLLLNTMLYPYFNVLDKMVEKDDATFWKSHYDVPYYASAAVLGLAFYEGEKSRLGKTAWKSIDAGLLSAMITFGLKNHTRRTRPIWNDNPNLWQAMDDEEGGFPSQHVAGTTALVTPFILEYQKDYPMVHLLWAFPIHQMVGRLKAQAHWQTDVLAGFGVGLISGLVAHHNDTPLLLSIAPDALSVGFKHKF